MHTASELAVTTKMSPAEISTAPLQRIDTIAGIRAALAPYRAQGKRIACVPTMGALHDGHLALADIARQHADVVVATIFVNPLQFGPNEDLAKYPRTLDTDLAALESRGVAFAFTPTNDEMYPPGHSIQVVAPARAATFEGSIRPGHFTGVLTVVSKLFNIVQPDVAVFGQKDLQQLSLIRALVRDLNIPVSIVAVPTVREPDGLAMSSRNRYLTPDDRRRATLLSQALNAVQSAFRSAHTAADQTRSRLLAAGRGVLDREPAIEVDYLALVDPDTFTETDIAVPGSAVIVAARVGSTRLIDNLIL